MIDIKSENLTNKELLDLLKTGVREMERRVHYGHVHMVDNEILQDVCTALSIPINKLRGNSRKQLYVAARIIYTHEVYEKYGHTYQRIAEALGNKHHTSIVHYRKQYYHRKQYDPKFRRYIDQYEKYKTEK